MADTTGPISTLPGARHALPEGTMCDDHPDRPATHRVQGETDSFGCELIDMCDECHAEHKKEMAESAAERARGTCDWCRQPATDLRPRRDYEEGSSGRVYDVCGACVRRQNEEATRELEESGYWDWD
jgi:hypothetical protein